MKKALLTALAVCGVIGTPSHAGDWRFIASTDTIACAFDASTVEVNGDIRGTWILTRPQYVNGGHTFELTWDEVDCRRKVTRTVNGFGTYSEYAGSNRLQPIDLPNTGWQKALPGTINAEVVKKVCSLSGDPFSKQDDFFSASRELKAFMQKRRYW